MTMVRQALLGYILLAVLIAVICLGLSENRSGLLPSEPAAAEVVEDFMVAAPPVTGRGEVLDDATAIRPSSDLLR